MRDKPTASKAETVRKKAQIKVNGRIPSVTYKRRKAYAKAIFADSRGEGYIDVVVLILCAMLVVALAFKVLPVFIAKQQLDTFVSELVREVEITGCVGAETASREQILREQTGLNPTVTWSRTGTIQLNDEIHVTVILDTDIGLFGGFGSFPIRLSATGVGKSEVYWK